MINSRSYKDINRISNVMTKNSSHRDQAIRKSKLLLDSSNLFISEENIPKKTIKTKNNLINNRLLFKPSKKLSSRTSFMSNDNYYPPFYMKLIIPKPYDNTTLNEYYTIYIDRNENKSYETFEEHFRQRKIAKHPKIARHIKYVNRPKHRPRFRPRHRSRSRNNNHYHNTIRYEHDYPYYYGSYLYYPFNYYFNVYDNNLPFDLNYAMIPLEIKDDSIDSASKNSASKNSASKDSVSKDSASKDSVSKDSASKVKEPFIPEGYKLIKVKIVDKAKKINLDYSKYLLFFIILMLFYFMVVKEN